MRQKQSTDRADWDPDLLQSQGRSAAAVEEQVRASGFHQRAGTELLQVDEGATSGSQQRDTQAVW